jgi:hypothetical protein
MPYERKTIDIFISDEMKNILKSIESDSLVAQLLLKKRHQKSELVDNPVNYISVSSQDKNKISYLNQDRIDILVKENINESDYWHTSKRYHVKPGSFISKIFKDITPKEVEKFSNLFKSESNKVEFTLKVVSGLDIKKYYHYDSYQSDRGTLGGSCMKHNSSQQLLDIYTENDNISMLVMLNSDGLLMGRALLWDFESYKIMDRVYTINDERLQWNFKKWATENNYLYKSEQNWYNTLLFENTNTPKKELFLKIDLKNKDFSKYPYMDTFKFIDSSNILYNHIPSDDIKTLCSTDGSKYEHDYLKFDFVNRIFRHRGECVYVSYMESYTHEGNTRWSSVNDQYILETDSIWDDEINDHIFKPEMNDRNNLDKIEEKRKSIKKPKKSKKSKLDKEVFDYFRNSIISSFDIPNHYFQYIQEQNTDSIEIVDEQ